MREISTKPIEVGEHVIIDGVEYVAEKADIRFPCKGCAFENKANPCSDFFSCIGIVYVKVKPESKYRPYKDTDEMIADWMERFGTYDSNVVMPPIWLMCGATRSIVTDYLPDSVYAFATNLTMQDLYEDYTYLDGTPCGKEISE